MTTNEVGSGTGWWWGGCWGAIEYRGPGVFIAGGAGITPFIAILRQQELQGKLAGNRLFVNNQKADDVILQCELTRMLGADAIVTLMQEQHRNYEHGRIDRHWLESRVVDFDHPFYLCGPTGMVKALSEILKSLGANTDSLVFEK